MTPIGIQYSYVIPLLPLLGAALAGFLGARWLKQQSHWPIWLGVGASAVLSFTILFGMLGKLHEGSIVEANPSYPYTPLVDPGRAQVAAQHEVGSYRLSTSQDWYTWIDAGTFKATAGFFFDPLTAVMLCVVCGIGFLITVFAAGYMKGEEGYFRFFAYLGLFIFAMTILVMGNNFIMLYLGWEGVGLCSYLLIGYYYDKPTAREAAKKAFLVNRVGDFGFGLGIMLAYAAFGTVSFFGSHDQPGVLQLATAPNLTAFQKLALEWLPFLLMIGAFGKSAQFPLYVWLPDAMEGPTPVSALIHAATMVTAGVYMIVRCSTLFVPNHAAMITIAIIGAFTAIFAGSIALRQFDLKKVFAYSTVSQLGFMFVGAAVLAPVAAVFHLVTHAFFKALLFLSSGVVMHAMMGELDMRKMSGLKRVLPWTHKFILVGCLALAGFPFFSGFFSKDEIVHAALEQSVLLGAVMLITAFMTAYYTFRLYFRVFQGPEVIPAAPAGGHGHGGHGHDDHSASTAHDAGHGHGGHDRGHHNHEPLVMILPLAVLTIGALLAGYMNWPKHSFGHFLGQSPSFILGYNTAVGRYELPQGQKERWAALDLKVQANTVTADERAEFDRLQRQAEAQHVDPTPFGQDPTRGTPDEAKKPHHGPWNSVMLISGLISAAGILLAYQMHLKDRPRAERLAERHPLVTRLLEAKYWVDEVYQAAIVEPLRKLGGLFFNIDRFVVDGLVWFVGFVPQVFAIIMRLTTQRGSLQGYAVAMLLSAAAILLVIFW